MTTVTNFLQPIIDSIGSALASIFRVLADLDIEAVFRNLTKTVKVTAEATFGTTSSVTHFVVGFMGVLHTIASILQNIFDTIADFLEDWADVNIKHRNYSLSGSIDPVVVVGDEDDNGVADDAVANEYDFSVQLSRLGGCTNKPVHIPTRANHQTTGTITVYVNYTSEDTGSTAKYNRFETHVYSFSDRGVAGEVCSDDVANQGSNASAMLELVEFSGENNNCLGSSINSPIRTLEGTELTVEMVGEVPKCLSLTFAGTLTGPKPEGFVEKIEVNAWAEMKYILVEK